jgi:hypothetical protein
MESVLRWAQYFASTSSLDARGPIGDLLYVKGTLYGTTYIGGTAGDGTVFEQKI